MDDVRVPRGAARRPGERDEQRGHEQAEPGPPAEVADHAVAVGDPEVPERERRHDLDLDALRTEVLDGVGDEPPDDVLRRARVRRREHDDLHGRQATVAYSAPAWRRSSSPTTKTAPGTSASWPATAPSGSSAALVALLAQGGRQGTSRPTGSQFDDFERLIREWILPGHTPAEPMLTADDLVVTLGSCFARELRTFLGRGRAARDHAPHPGGPEQHVCAARFHRLVRHRIRDRARLPLRPARVRGDPRVGRRGGARDLRRRIRRGGGVRLHDRPGRGLAGPRDGRRVLARRPEGDLRRRPPRVPADDRRGERRATSSRWSTWSGRSTRPRRSWSRSRRCRWRRRSATSPA